MKLFLFAIASMMVVGGFAAATAGGTLSGGITVCTNVTNVCTGVANSMTGSSSPSEIAAFIASLQAVISAWQALSDLILTVTISVNDATAAISLFIIALAAVGQLFFALVVKLVVFQTLGLVTQVHGFLTAFNEVLSNCCTGFIELLRVLGVAATAALAYAIDICLRASAQAIIKFTL